MSGPESVEQLRAALRSAQQQRDDALAELARERAIYADNPDDRLYHAADHTWWRRTEDGRLVRADAPATDGRPPYTPADEVSRHG